MNRAICINTWREFKSNKVRVIMLTLLVLGPLASFTFSRCNSMCAPGEDLITHQSIALAFAFLWGAGAIGREVQHGTISLVLARPVTIVNYVFSKWFAVGFASAVCAVQALLIEHGISVLLNPQLLTSLDFLYNGFERVELAFGLSAVLIFFSSLVSGLKDLAVIAGSWLAFCVAAQTAGAVESVVRSYNPTLGALSEHTYNVMGMALLASFYPDIPLEKLLSAGGDAWGSLIFYFTVISVFLAMSIFIMTRKEFSYAQD